MKQPDYIQLVITSSPITPPQIVNVPVGLTLTEILRYIPGLPARFWDEGAITINGDFIDERWWNYLRPKKTAVIQLHLAPAGGSKKGGKNVLAIVASVLLMVVTVGIGAGLLPVIGIGSLSTLGAGTLGAQALAALVGLGGQLLIGALFPPPTPTTAANEVNSIERADIQDNILGKGQRLPRIAGLYRVSPPLLCQPYSYLVGNDEVAEAVYGLYGPHDIIDPKVKGVPLDDLAGVTYVIDRGIAGEPRTQLFTRHGKTTPIQTVVSQHQMQSGDDALDDVYLLNQADPVKSLPQWHRMKTFKGPNEIIIRLIMASITRTGGNPAQATHMRLRIRKAGETTWKNLPQTAYKSKSPNTYRKEIILKLYKPDQTVAPGGTTGNNRFVGAQGDILQTSFQPQVRPSGDPTYQWQATCGTWRSVIVREGLVIFLDDVYFNDREAIWEIEFMCGMAEETSKFTIGGSEGTDAAILSSGQSGEGGFIGFEMFGAYMDGTGWVAPDNIEDRTGSINIDKITSIFDIPPVESDIYAATVQVQVRNVDFSQFSVLAGGLVPYWDGTTWTGLQTSRNPAPHWREMYINTLSMGVDSIEPKYMDNVALLGWMDACDTNGWECNGIMEGSFQDAEQMLTTCGYARPVCDTKYGVVWERDTTVETAKQMFTPLNTRDMEFSIAYTKRPVGFRIEFFNEESEYEKDEIIVFDPYAIEGITGELETLTYPAITNKLKARDRALYDFKQANKAARYNFTCGIEHIATKQGDVALLSHHTLQNHVDYYSVKKVIGLDRFVIDRSCDFVTSDGFFQIPDLFEYPDVFAAGQEVGLISRSPTDDSEVVIIHDVLEFNSATNTFRVEDATMMRPGDIIIIGPLTTSTKRTIILDIEPQDQMTARVTVQDE